MAAGSETKKAYDENYQKQNIRQIRLSMNRKTEPEILEWLEKKENIQGYIKKIIREDMMMKKFEVALANREAIFDSGSFGTIGEAVEWMSGRGGIYTAQISHGDGMGISISVNSDTGEMKYFDGDEWITVQLDQIEKMLK